MTWPEGMDCRLAQWLSESALIHISSVNQAGSCGSFCVKFIFSPRACEDFITQSTNLQLGLTGNSKLPAAYWQHVVGGVVVVLKKKTKKTVKQIRKSHEGQGTVHSLRGFVERFRVQCPVFKTAAET